ncbi:hypothetical protein MBANPS3_012613, partial [Mucor bainieri]
MLIASQWTFLEAGFKKKFKIEDSNLPPWAQDHWDEASSQVNLEDGFAVAKQTMYRHLAAPESTRKNMDELLLSIFDTSEYLSVSEVLSEKASEADYLYQGWLPIFTKLLAGTGVKLTIGETVNSETTEQKMLVYRDSTNIIGFKTDIRFYVKNGGISFDVASVEAGKQVPGSTKMKEDHAKLMREGKCNAAALCRATGGAVSHSWNLQVSGRFCILSTINYCDYDMHAAISQDTPSSSVQSFTKVVDKEANMTKAAMFVTTLYKLRNDLAKTAENIRVCLQPKDIMEPTIGVKYAPTSYTFFTPPKEDLSRARFPEINDE